MSIKKTKDIKLVVQPVIGIMVHEYVFEGPCRFGAGDTLTLEFDRMVGADGYKAFRDNLTRYIAPEQDFQLLEPVSCEITESFEVTEAMMAELTKNDDKADVYLFTSIGRTYPIVLELATRTRKPFICLQECCDKTQVPAMLRSRGLECVSEMTWEETVEKMRAFRLRKLLRESKLLLVTRAFTNSALVSACDGFLNLDEAAQVFGFRYQCVDVHEFLDQSHMEGTPCPTLPTRRPMQFTAADLAQWEDMADRLIAGAGSCNVSKPEVVNGLRFYATVKKFLDHYECNAFSAPCSEMCATTRLNQEHMTPCFAHSLLNAEGISSACEYDIPGLLAQIMLSGAARAGAYMGNCVPLYYEADGRTVATFMAPSNDLQEKVNAMTDQERENLIITYHSSINLQMHGYDAPPLSYDIRNYTASGWGPTMRHDFRENKGQVLTMARVSPDAKTLFVARGTVVAGTGEQMSGCTQGVLFSVNDRKDFFQKQCNVGNHVPMVMADCFDQLVELGHLLGLNVVTA